VTQKFTDEFSTSQTKLKTKQRLKHINSLELSHVYLFDVL